MNSTDTVTDVFAIKGIRRVQWGKYRVSLSTLCPTFVEALHREASCWTCWSHSEVSYQSDVECFLFVFSWVESKPPCSVSVLTGRTQEANGVWTPLATEHDLVTKIFFSALHKSLERTFNRAFIFRVGNSFVLSSYHLSKSVDTQNQVASSIADGHTHQSYSLLCNFFLCGDLVCLSVRVGKSYLRPLSTISPKYWKQGTLLVSPSGLAYHMVGPNSRLNYDNIHYDDEAWEKYHGVKLKSLEFPNGNPVRVACRLTKVSSSRLNFLTNRSIFYPVDLLWIFENPRSTQRHKRERKTQLNKLGVVEVNLDSGLMPQQIKTGLWSSLKEIDSTISTNVEQESNNSEDEIVEPNQKVEQSRQTSDFYQKDDNMFRSLNIYELTSSNTVTPDVRLYVQAQKQKPQISPSVLLSLSGSGCEKSGSIRVSQTSITTTDGKELQGSVPQMEGSINPKKRERDDTDSFEINSVRKVPRHHMDDTTPHGRNQNEDNTYSTTHQQDHTDFPLGDVASPTPSMLEHTPTLILAQPVLTQPTTDEVVEDWTGKSDLLEDLGDWINNMQPDHSLSTPNPSNYSTAVASFSSNTNGIASSTITSTTLASVEQANIRHSETSSTLVKTTIDEVPFETQYEVSIDPSLASRVIEDPGRSLNTFDNSEKRTLRSVSLPEDDGSEDESHYDSLAYPAFDYLSLVPVEYRCKQKPFTTAISINMFPTYEPSCTHPRGLVGKSGPRIESRKETRAEEHEAESMSINSPKSLSFPVRPLGTEMQIEQNPTWNREESISLFSFESTDSAKLEFLLSWMFPGHKSYIDTTHRESNPSFKSPVPVSASISQNGTNDVITPMEVSTSITDKTENSHGTKTSFSNSLPFDELLNYALEQSALANCKYMCYQQQRQRLFHISDHTSPSFTRKPFSGSHGGESKEHISYHPLQYQLRHNYPVSFSENIHFGDIKYGSRDISCTKDETVRVLTRVAPVLSEFLQTPSTAIKVEGPMTLPQWSNILRQEAETIDTPSGKSQVEILEKPSFIVSYKSSKVAVDSSQLPFWEKLQLEPYSPKKNINYIVLADCVALNEIFKREFNLSTTNTGVVNATTPQSNVKTDFTNTPTPYATKTSAVAPNASPHSALGQFPQQTSTNNVNTPTLTPTAHSTPTTSNMGSTTTAIGNSPACCSELTMQCIRMFFNELDSVYETCNLGEHKPLDTAFSFHLHTVDSSFTNDRQPTEDHIKNHIENPPDNFSGNRPHKDIEKYLSMCRQAGFYLSDKLSRVSDSITVVYMVNNLSVEQQYTAKRAILERIMSGHTHASGTSYKSSATEPSNIDQIDNERSNNSTNSKTNTPINNGSSKTNKGTEIDNTTYDNFATSASTSQHSQQISKDEGKIITPVPPPVPMGEVLGSGSPDIQILDSSQRSQPQGNSSQSQSHLQQQIQHQNVKIPSIVLSTIDVDVLLDFYSQISKKSTGPVHPTHASDINRIHTDDTNVDLRKEGKSPAYEEHISPMFSFSNYYSDIVDGHLPFILYRNCNAMMESQKIKEIAFDTFVKCKRVSFPWQQRNKGISLKLFEPWGILAPTLSSISNSKAPSTNYKSTNAKGISLKSSQNLVTNTTFDETNVIHFCYKILPCISGVVVTCTDASGEFLETKILQIPVTSLIDNPLGSSRGATLDQSDNHSEDERQWSQQSLSDILERVWNFCVMVLPNSKPNPLGTSTAKSVHKNAKSSSSRSGSSQEPGKKGTSKSGKLGVGAQSNDQNSASNKKNVKWHMVIGKWGSITEQERHTWKKIIETTNSSASSLNTVSSVPTVVSPRVANTTTTPIESVLRLVASATLVSLSFDTNFQALPQIPNSLNSFAFFPSLSPRPLLSTVSSSTSSSSSASSPSLAFSPNKNKINNNDRGTKGQAKESLGASTPAITSYIISPPAGIPSSVPTWQRELLMPNLTILQVKYFFTEWMTSNYFPTNNATTPTSSLDMESSISLLKEITHQYFRLSWLSCSPPAHHCAHRKSVVPLHYMLAHRVQHDLSQLFLSQHYFHQHISLFSHLPDHQQSTLQVTKPQSDQSLLQSQWQHIQTLKQETLLHRSTKRKLDQIDVTTTPEGANPSLSIQQPQFQQSQQQLQSQQVSQPPQQRAERHKRQIQSGIQSKQLSKPITPQNLGNFQRPLQLPVTQASITNNSGQPPKLILRTKPPVNKNTASAGSSTNFGDGGNINGRNKGTN